jgi:mono/diheme cytochrome c family protein
MRCPRKDSSAATIRTGLAAGFVAISALGSVAQHATYSQEQVAEGQQVFNAHCSQCHGADLQGQSGPALAGPQFKSSLEYSKMSAKQLFDFMSKQMPYNDPGSLSKDKYLEALAYILSKNNYPASHDKLTEKNLAEVELLPYPAGSQTQTSKGK